MINNITSLYVYDDDVKYIFLGDIHEIKNNDCGISIDDLLTKWLQYNEQHQIRTNLFAEVFFTKAHQRKTIKGNPLQTLSQTLPYFTPTKTHQYVQFHYVDIRNIDEGIIQSIDPFDLYRLRYLYSNNRVSIDKVIKIINTIQNHYLLLLKLLLHPMNFNNIKMFTELDKSYSIVFQHIYNHAVIRNGKRMSRAAAALYKLYKVNSNLYMKILEFIFNKAKSIQLNFDELEIIKYGEQSTINQLLQTIDTDLLPLGALVMDAYVLARMFYYNLTEKIDEVIIYAGNNHIKLYVEFFETLKKYPIYYIENENQCIDDENLLNYLNINQY